MRKLVFIFVCALSVLSMQAVDITLVSNAFKNGDATMLANNMNSEVDIAVPNVSQKGSGADATAVLTQFFQSNKPSGFTVAHHADKSDCGKVNHLFSRYVSNKCKRQDYSNEKCRPTD